MVDKDPADLAFGEFQFSGAAIRNEKRARVGNPHLSAQSASRWNWPPPFLDDDAIVHFPGSMAMRHRVPQPAADVASMAGMEERPDRQQTTRRGARRRQRWPAMAPRAERAAADADYSCRALADRVDYFRMRCNTGFGAPCNPSVWRQMDDTHTIAKNTSSGFRSLS